MWAKKFSYSAGDFNLFKLLRLVIFNKTTGDNKSTKLKRAQFYHGKALQKEY